MKTKSRWALIALAIVLLVASSFFLLRKDEPRVPPFPISLRDDAGVTSTISSSPEKVVSLAPQFTETLFEIGAGHLLVGVGAGETYPPEATALTVIPTDETGAADPIRIFELGADLVLTTGGDADWKRSLRNNGVVVVSLDATSVTDAFEDMITIGITVGRRAQAMELVTHLSDQLARIASTVEGELPANQRVFVETFADPLLGASPGGYVDDIVSRAGGVLATRPDSDPSKPWTVEAIGNAAPDVYIAPLTSAFTGDEVAKRPGFSKIKAVMQDRVLIVPDDILFRPGPRLTLAVQTLAVALYPEVARVLSIAFA